MLKFIIWFFASLILSFVFTWLLFATMAIKGKARNWMLLLLGLLPILFTYLWNPISRTIVNHGFFHISTVYQIINGNIPPNDSLFAGESLTYPWGYHLLAAGITSGLHISPANAFALINLFSLLLTMILVFRTAIFGFSNWITSIFAVVLSVFGVSIFNRGSIAEVLKHLSNFFTSESRVALPNKFFNIAPTCLGILFFALFLYSIIHIFLKTTRINLYCITLTVSLLGAGFLYPQFWPALFASSLSSVAVIYLRYRKKALSSINRILVCVAVTTLIVLPYLYQIGSGNSDEATTVLNIDFQFILIKFFRYLWGTLPLSIILVWKRKALKHLLRLNTDYTLILITVTVTTALMYIFISFSLTNEYKYYIVSWFTLGILASVCLHDIYLSNKVICFLLISSFLLFTSSDLLYFSFGNSGAYHSLGRYGKWQASDEYIENGIYLRHSNPNENTLYQWISTQTKPDAIFVDSHLTIPVFGQRQLYIALDLRRQGFTNETKDGWGMTAESFLKVQGHPSEMVNERRRIVETIYSQSGSKISEDVFSHLNKTSGKKDVYIVARNVKFNNNLENDNHVVKVFETADTAVYKLLKNVE